MIVKQFGKSKTGTGTFSTDEGDDSHPSSENPKISNDIKNQLDNEYTKSTLTDDNNNQ